MFGFLRKSQESEAKAKEAAANAQELNHKLQESQNELQTALQAAKTASKAKTDFLSNMSHDIRTPMNAIVGLTNLMENDLSDTEKVHEYLEKLKSSNQHLLNLINEILDMNKIEAGKAVLAMEPISLESKLGEGSKFEVMLEFKIDQEADDAVKQMNLLLLRCDDADFECIKDAIVNSPVRIFRTTGPEEAVQVLQSRAYEVVLMPYPKYEHYEGGLKAAVKWVRELAGTESILLGIASTSQEEALDTISGSGLDGFVPLPFFLSNVEEEAARVRELRRLGGKPDEPRGGHGRTPVEAGGYGRSGTNAEKVSCYPPPQINSGKTRYSRH